MTTPYARGGQAVLTLAHVAGMVDMVALPVWIGTLMQHYGESPQQAGITVTAFLLCAVLASLFLAPRFHQLPHRPLTTAGFALAGVAFWIASLQPVDAASHGFLVALHGMAGLGVGCGLSFTDGCIGRAANPHRMFAVVNMALGVFAVAFLGGVPVLVQTFGAATLFKVLALVMGIATVAVGLYFPRTQPLYDPSGSRGGATLPRARPIPLAVWLIVGVIICLAMNQAMVFAFLERIGAERGFGSERVNGVLIALGLVNLTPGLLAAWLQKKWSPVAVGFAGPVGQALLAVTMTSAVSFLPYAISASVYVFMVIFTHTFLFGMLTRLDPSGRAAAATPAMMMLGAGVGPALGGAVVQASGYGGLGFAACGIAALALIGMALVRHQLSTATPLGGSDVFPLNPAAKPIP